MVASTLPAQENYRRLAPEDIFPKRGARISGTYSRDWNQSDLAGGESSANMHNVAVPLDRYHEAIPHYPGVEEAGGGTVPRMDVTIRNEDPFRHIEELKERLPNTPLSALIRSDAGAGMEEVSSDVLTAYLEEYHRAGIQVFRNFHAFNDVRAHVRVARALHEIGEKCEAEGLPRPHFQAAYSYATYDEDKSVYNRLTPITFFKRLEKELKKAAREDGKDENAYLPHSYAIKDPSGVLTPEMAEQITREFNAARDAGKVKDIPFGIHTHNQMGHAAETCIAAVEAGANFVEGAAEPGGYGAQPSMLKLARALGGETGEALGFATREAFDAAKASLETADKLCEHVLKNHNPKVRQEQPDSTVPSHCIAGGQRSIAYNEAYKNLTNNGKREVSGEELEAFMQKIKAIMPTVRRELGVPCLVTPVADYIFREALRRATPGKNPDKGFHCGYRRMMCGEMGPSKEPVDPIKQQQALLERIQDRIKKLPGLKDLKEAEIKELQQNEALVQLRDVMWEHSKPARDRLRLEEVESRIEELNELRASSFAPEGTRMKLAALKEERAELLKTPAAERDKTADAYNELLKASSRKLCDDMAAGEISDSVELCRQVLKKADKLDQLGLSETDKIRLIKAASYTTLPIGEILQPNGLQKAEEKLRKLAEQGRYKIPEDPRQLRRDVIIGRMLRDPHVDNPDALLEKYFLMRDFPEKLEPKDRLPAPAAPSFEITAQFASPMNVRKLQTQIGMELIKNNKWDAAANLFVKPAEAKEPGVVAFRIGIEKVKDAANIGVHIIKEKISDLKGTVQWTELNRTSAEKFEKRASISASVASR